MESFPHCYRIHCHRSLQHSLLVKGKNQATQYTQSTITLRGPISVEYSRFATSRFAA